MKKFPQILSVHNKNKFPALNRIRLKCYLRKYLYEHIISHEEKDYFSIDQFNEKHVGNLEVAKQLLSELVPELEELGWKCSLYFGGTGIFVYSETCPIMGEEF